MLLYPRFRLVSLLQKCRFWMAEMLLLERSRALRAGRFSDESILSKVLRVQCKLVRLDQRATVLPPVAVTFRHNMLAKPALT